MHSRWNEYFNWNPPNIIISDYAYQQTGSEFNFFDFSKVGLIVTISGILFIVFIGKRLIPMRDVSDGAPLIDLKGFLFEVKVNKGSSSAGLTLYQFNKQAGDDIEIMGIVSDTGSLKKVKNNMRIKEDQILVIKGSPNEFDTFLERFDFSIPKELHGFVDEDLEEIECLLHQGHD